MSELSGLRRDLYKEKAGSYFKRNKALKERITAATDDEVRDEYVEHLATKLEKKVDIKMALDDEIKALKDMLKQHAAK